MLSGYVHMSISASKSVFNSVFLTGVHVEWRVLDLQLLKAAFDYVLAAKSLVIAWSLRVQFAVPSVLETKNRIVQKTQWNFTHLEHSCAV